MFYSGSPWKIFLYVLNCTQFVSCRVLEYLDHLIKLIMLCQKITESSFTDHLPINHLLHRHTMSTTRSLVLRQYMRTLSNTYSLTWLLYKRKRTDAGTEETGNQNNKETEQIQWMGTISWEITLYEVTTSLFMGLLLQERICS